MNVTFIVGLWMVFGSLTLVLAIYRWVLSAHNENDVVHLGAGEEKEIPGFVGTKIHAIDSWQGNDRGHGGDWARLATAHIRRESLNLDPIISTATIACDKKVPVIRPSLKVIGVITYWCHG
jgi:hypothetical protein